MGSISLRRLLAVALPLFLLIADTKTSAQDPESEDMAPAKSLSRMILPGTNELQLILRLESPSVVEYMLETGGLAAQARNASEQRRPNLHSATAASHRSRLAREQGTLIQALSNIPGVRVEAATDTVMNTVIVRAPVERYQEIRRLPGVQKVYFSRPHKRLLDAAASIVNAPALWNAAGGRALAGKGVKIGILDSGIDITNPMFIDDSLTVPSGFPKGESAFTNKKVIVARNYISLLARSQIVQSAIDEGGHGSFCAGVAAGKQVTAPNATISGMAPAAFLGSYKLFGSPGVNDSTTTAAIIAAINGAVADGMDVINLSLGALDYLPPSEDAETVAVRNAIASGVLVVASAGNDGPDLHTIGSPGAIPEVLAVGSVTNSRKLAPSVKVTAPSPVPTNISSIAYEAGDGPQVGTAISATRIVDVATLDGTGLGCSTFTANSLSSSIALIKRGTCLFTDKVSHAQAAGATAVILYNNVAGNDTITMSGLSSIATPAVMIGNTDGVNLKSFISAHPGAVMVSVDTATALSLVPTTERIISEFSSVGPGTDFSIKPDMVAVGSNIYSAAQANNANGELYSTAKFTTASGTSFSSPMVAGAAAGLRQLFPNLGPMAIKSILTSTTSQNVSLDGTNAADILHMGSGLLDMGAAASAKAWFSATALNFGTQAYSDSLSLTRSFTINNISSEPDRYRISVVPYVSGATTTLSQTETASVAAGGSAAVDFTLRVTSPASRGFQGFIQVQSESTSTVYRIPYWAGLYVNDPSRVLTLNSAGTGGYSSVAAAVQAARPGNVIEIADSSTYSSAATIDTNDEGLPLHGLTIRAAQGQTPVLDGTGEYFALSILGVRNVLLQGLTMNGGAAAVEIDQATTSLPASVTIDRCKITGSEDSSEGSIYAPYGGGVNVTQSTISGSSGAGIMVDNGAYLTVVGSTVQGNDSDGLDAMYSSLQVLNSTISDNYGPGFYVISSMGTISGNTIARNSGFYGDGFELSDSTVTVKNNTIDANERAGIGIFDTVSSTIPSRISENIVRGNVYGILGNPARGAIFDGNLVEDNGRGVRLNSASTALLTNNIVVRSTDTSQGDGIQALGGSNATLVNNTVYGNKLRGLNVSGGASVSVHNSIVASNSSGDLSGLTQANVQYSLIGDGTFSGSNGNFTGDPKFVNPSGNDFSLGTGSPAVDAGNNSDADLPFLDYEGRLRVASTTSLPGEGKVDVGAVESNSAYPLIFPVVAGGAQPAFGDTVTTGYAVINSGSAPTGATFAAYTPSGGLLAGSTNPASRTINAGAQVPILGFQLFGFDAGASVFASALASAPQPLSGFFLLFDSDFSRFADGAVASGQTGDDLYFDRHLFDATGKATYTVFNPGINTANIRASLMSSQGAVLGTPKTVAVPAKGQSVFSFDNLTTSSGYVHVESDRPVAGMELYGKSPVISALNAVSPGTEARLFFPHVAVNGGFTSMIGIINSNRSTAHLKLTAYDSAGTVVGNPVDVTLLADAQLLQSVQSLFGIASGPMVTGYIVAEGDVPGIQGFTEFLYDDGSHKSEAAVPADSVPRQHLVFSHVAHQVPAGSGESYLTGIGLLNPFGAPVTFTLKVFDGTGAKVAETQQTLAPGQKVAKMLSHPVAGAGFFTQTIPLSSGHIEVDTDYGLMGFELFFTETFSQLASVPPQN